MLKKCLLIATINVAAGVGAVLAFYAYGKLTYPDYFCGSFAVIDPQLGWVIAPNASSCIGGKQPFAGGPPWFEGKVFSDANGFRSNAPGTPTPTGGIMAIGDSWTFGYGVSYANSYPGKLEALTGTPAVVAASPAYSSAQAIMLAERWVDQLKPRAMVYLDLGFWDRSACRGARKPQAILKPCYWQAPGGPSAMLVVPPPGRVEAFASWGVMPGGMIGAGEDNWSYFLISRPVSIGYQVLARTGLVPGFGHDFSAIGVNTAAIRRGVLDHLVRLGTQARVPLLIIDPYDAYSDMFAALPPEQKTNLGRVGRDVWLRAVVGPMSKLPPELATVPHDGHFGPGANALIAALIAERLQELGVALGRPTKH